MAYTKSAGSRHNRGGSKHHKRGGTKKCRRGGKGLAAVQLAPFGLWAMNQYNPSKKRMYGGMAGNSSSGQGSHMSNNNNSSSGQGSHIDRSSQSGGRRRRHRSKKHHRRRKRRGGSSSLQNLFGGMKLF